MAENLKNKLIQQICEISEENPVFLCNYSTEDLQEYLEYLQNLKTDYCLSAY